MRRNEVGNDRADAYLRITVSRGEGEIGFDPGLCAHADCRHHHEGAPTLSGRTSRERRIADRRQNAGETCPEALSPHIKATNFLNNILAKRESIAAGTFDSLLLNWRDELTECTISNLFFVSGQPYTRRLWNAAF